MSIKIAQELWKEIINPVVGLYLGDKVIPQNSRGIVSDSNYEHNTVGIQWKISNKDVYTKLSHLEYITLVEGKVLGYVEDYIEPPKSRFEIGDLVDGITLGVVRSKRYDSVNKTWEYTLVQADFIMESDYDLRFRVEEEKYMKLVNEIDIDIDFGGRDYTLKISEKPNIKGVKL